jgi:hypothetical protein
MAAISAICESYSFGDGLERFVAGSNASAMLPGSS